MAITKGISFPLSINQVRGTLDVSQEGELFKGHILSFLLTMPRERVMRPQYGMQDPLFDSIQDMTTISAEIREGLISYVPGIDFQVTGNISDQGEAVVNIYWSYEDKDETITVTL
ncbi:hypothetical protein NIES2100_35000 [Calothrix sp. NIES-2100]|uniref:hypothetical protein n=1 Tax=Calothrix sp. NIES-2100 TaxID=1954172 RepID=UPI000B5F54C1|nr:hypothetical protein NIES2100_35000 [Calothrix sp. NIES-2100]